MTHTEEKNIPETNSSKEKNVLQSAIKEFFRFAFLAAIIVIPFRMFIAQPFVVNGASMDPTFHSGEYLIVDQLIYRFENPERGSILIFKYPRDPSKYFIKRVIGLPSETVEIRDGQIWILNEEYPEGFLLEEPYVEHERGDNMTVVLDSDEYFVLGDNRQGSSDSRVWGTLPEQLVVGRPIVRLFPPAKASILPGDYSKNYTH